MNYCNWPNMTVLDRHYHDTEWGVPTHDDRAQFENLSLEVMQCGLSWALVLKRRDLLRECFDGFDIESVAAYSDDDVKRILNTPGMIRSERKIRAIIANAQAMQRVQAECGSFSTYIWAFTGGKTLVYEAHAEGDVPASNDLSERISKDLKRRGFKYVGAVTGYSHLEACGIINDHAADCPCHKRICEMNDWVRMADE